MCACFNVCGGCASTVWHGDRPHRLTPACVAVCSLALRSSMPGTCSDLACCLVHQDLVYQDVLGWHAHCSPANASPSFSSVMMLFCLPVSATAGALLRPVYSRPESASSSCPFLSRSLLAGLQFVELLAASQPMWALATFTYQALVVLAALPAARQAACCTPANARSSPAAP